MDVYNLVMDERTIQKLLEINKQFYQNFGDEFSATRGRIQPGVRSILENLDGNENILDLGCGNGEVAKQLVKLGHKGTYTGLELSRSLLKAANGKEHPSSTRFLLGDLASKDWDQQFGEDQFDMVFAFATLHHIPSILLRKQIITKAKRLLTPKGSFIHSNWQFLNSPRLKGRIQPWSSVGMDDKELDEGDYLLDWKRGGNGLRYVHHFSESELRSIANETGFQVYKSFLSDGYENRLGLYQLWELTDYKSMNT